MGSPYALLMWSKDAASEEADGANIIEGRTEGWQIVDAEDQNTALSATGLPVINQEWRPGSRFRCKSRNPQRTGPRTWEAILNFGVPPGGSYAQPDPDPRNRPKRLSIVPGFVSLPMDHDALKRVVRNSAGSFFDPLPTQDRMSETLTVRWFTDLYDRARYRKFINRVNSDTFTIGNTTVLPGECRCASIAPPTEFSVDTTLIEMQAVFELQSDARAPDGTSGDPFDEHRVDRGRILYYADSNDSGKIKRGYACTSWTPPSSSAPQVLSVISEDILLDGTGKPLGPASGDTSSSLIKVTPLPDGTGNVFDPVSNPDKSCWIVTDKNSPSYNASPFDSPACRMFLFRRHQRVPFLGLL